MASLYVQLGEGTSQRGVYGGDLFGREFFPQANSGALTCFLRCGFVNALKGDCHVGDDGHVIIGYFNQTFPYGQVVLVAVFVENQLTWHHLRHEAHMLRQHAHLSLYAGQSYHIDRF